MIRKEIALLVSYLKNEPTFDADGIDLSYLLKLGVDHSLITIVYEAILFYNVKIDEKLKEKLEKKYRKCVYKEAIQELEKKQILDSFSLAQIKCMPLKGSILKYFYKSPVLRTMNDLDILIDYKQKKKAYKILKDLGYSGPDKTDHHDSFQKLPIMDVELHKRLVPERDKIIYQYYNKIWNKLIETSDKYIYKMSDEDFYIYFIVHLSKHYKEGGCGLRYLFDCYIYLSNFTNLNFDYINQEMEKLNLSTFEKNFTNLSFDLFDGQNLSTLENDMLSYIIDSKTHGTIDHAQAVLVETENGKKTHKVKYLMKRVFPSTEFMKNKYDILNHLPFLLPFMYIHRFNMALFRHKGLIKDEFNNLNNFDVKKAEKIKELHKKSGL